MRVTRANGRRAGSGGFSLTEVSVGMAVVGIVCVALYSGLTSGLATVRLARENERATQIMTEKLDTIRLYSWDKVTNAGFIPATFTKSFGPTNAGPDQALVSSGIIYTGRVTIGTAPVAPAYSANMRQVTVTLNWVSGAVPRQRTMTTLVAKDGMQNYVY